MVRLSFQLVCPFKAKRELGDVIYTEAFGQSIVILNSVTAARDLLEKKSNVFSDRPYLPVGNMMGWGLILPFLRYGPRFRKHRRIFQHCFAPQAISAFRHTQDRELLKFLRCLLISPDDFIMHIHSLISGIIVSITYGHEVVAEPDPLVQLIERAVQGVTNFGNLGTTVLDILPFMRYAPSWLPGMGVKRLIPRARELVDRVKTQPFEELKAKRAKGVTPSCIMSDLLDQYEEMQAFDPEHEADIMNVGLAIYAAGSDTTKTTLKALFLNMTIQTEVAKKVQEEIDKVVGRDRLPRLEDRDDLPYLNCVLKEMYRYVSRTRTCIPHRSTKTEQYRGWTIPAGSMAIANIWCMMRDEKSFPDPDAFIPERHMANVMAESNISRRVSDKDIPAGADDDPSNIVFGFGRRSSNSCLHICIFLNILFFIICPGKYLADSTLWLVAANVLALFDILPYVDPDTGKAENPKLEIDGEGFIAYPKAFRCRIIPRDTKQVETMLMAV
ncbi:cytochrome P450 [Fomitiporia mediterranea MF3/22]|uniref:Cytochrome P450 n=1 Tax=Fomitiporia mediterranea (strain MF3/22) TaxID=694068 RepID=R7SGF1_FOMME|nr:cytochrome P450 [Fomitiporia mediterranea MF3/22]EJC97786.1 cytochrome P450 [Fomitiporia mediterranea MF3/22]